MGQSRSVFQKEDVQRGNEQNLPAYAEFQRHASVCCHAASLAVPEYFRFFQNVAPYRTVKKVSYFAILSRGVCH
jgi:hypothetical protein